VATNAFSFVLLAAMAVGTLGCDTPDAPADRHDAGHPDEAGQANEQGRAYKADGATPSTSTTGEVSKTPMDQSQDSNDVKISGEIRQQVLAHESLGTNADNAKIITEQGVVTLEGQVDSAAESQTLEQIARGVAGVTRVENRLQVAPPQQ
jgi:osmotically-inducible protein OsmY